MSLRQIKVPIHFTFFPLNVSRDYYPFTFYQFIQSITGTMAGTISTQCLLIALGLGQTQAVGLAATSKYSIYFFLILSSWIIKDGFGLLGGVLFSLMGSRFDASPKRFIYLQSLIV
jgi:hypothetical protein